MSKNSSGRDRDFHIYARLWIAWLVGFGGLTYLNPPAGLIVGGLYAVMLLAIQFIGRRDSLAGTWKAPAKYQNGIWTAEYALEVKVIALGTVMLSCGLAVTWFFVSPEDRIYVFRLILLFGALGIPLFLEAFFVKIKFDESTAYCYSPWRASRQVRFSDMGEPFLSQTMEGWVIPTENQGNIRLHQWLSGASQLLEILKEARHQSAVVRFHLTLLSRFRIVIEETGLSFSFMIVSSFLLYEFYQRGHAGLMNLPIPQWLIVVFSVFVTSLFAWWFVNRIQACRRAQWYGASFIYNSRRIVRLSRRYGHESCRWCDLEHVGGGVRIIGKVRSLFEVPAPTTLYFKDGKEIELIPEGNRVFTHFRPLLDSVADESGQGSPLLEVVKRLEEDKRIRNSPILKVLFRAWKKIVR